MFIILTALVYLYLFLLFFYGVYKLIPILLDKSANTIGKELEGMVDFVEQQVRR